MLSTVVLSNENQTCRGWEAPTSTGGGGCHKPLHKSIFLGFNCIAGQVTNTDYLILRLHPFRQLYASRNEVSVNCGKDIDSEGVFLYNKPIEIVG